MPIAVKKIPTTPFEGQQPGSNGLRKQVANFQEANYTENFVQAVLTAGLGDKLSGSTLLVGGDGRYFLHDAIQIVIRIAAANGVAKLIIGQRGLLSTPAVSCLIRKYKANGAIILTASGCPGGKNGDFGIKFNMSNGGPATEEVNDTIFEMTKTVSELTICLDLHCDLDILAVHVFEIEKHGHFVVEVVDSVKDYGKLMKEIFDFDALRRLFNRRCPLKILLDSMHGVTGPYVKHIFVDELGVSVSSLVNVEPLEDVGGINPDPNLTYAAELVNTLKGAEHGFGAAFGGDGGQNMVMGQNAFFVSLSDSLAVLANNMHCVPYFRNTGIRGFARSMPTAGAVDRVAKAKGKDCFEVPNDWTFFGNLMDAGCLSLCGQENAGIGSFHIRESDGIWVTLAWLQVLEAKQKSVKQLLMEHWHIYGRHFFTRLDYEHCDWSSANRVMEGLQKLVSEDMVGRKFTSHGKVFKVAMADDFSYTEPTDNSVHTKQGIRIVFTDDSRIIFRLSGSGSNGATIHVYIQGYENDSTTYQKDAQVVLKPLIDLAVQTSKLKEHTGRCAPIVII